MRHLAVALVAIGGGHAIAAPDEPIVLASGDDAFRAALADALAPAGMAVVLVEHPPSPTIGDVAAESRTLADEGHASATVWLVFEGSGATLVTYDREVDRVLVRALPFISPLTSEQAAEAARMARTMLRALRVTPDLNLPPPHAAEAAAVRARAAAPPVTPLVVPTVPSLLAFDIAGGVRLGGPAADASVEGRMTLTWRPDRIGAAFTVAVDPSANVRSAAFMGEIVDDSLALAARFPVRITDRLAIAGLAGGALHIVKLDGDVVAGGHAAIARFDPAARVGLAATFMVGSVGIGAGVTADWLVRRQSYEVGSTEILAFPRFQLSAGLGIAARIW